MLIHASFTGRPTVAVDVHPDDILKKLKLRAATSLRVNPELMALVISGEQVDDETVELKDTGLEDGDTLVVRQVKLEKKIERRERALSNARFEVRKKARWFEKIFNAQITDKWTSEMLAQFQPDSEIYRPIPFDTESTVALMLAQLEDEARLATSGTPKRTPPPMCMRADDDMMPADFAAKLDKALEVFRTTPDWHPGSNNQVLDLVHPSLYCYVSSSAYLWLPTEFQVEGETQVRQLSYINNVDPAKHGAEVEALLGEALGRMLPLLRKVRNPTAEDADIDVPEAPELTEAELAEVREVEEAVLDNFVSDALEDYGDDCPPSIQAEFSDNGQTTSYIQAATRHMPVVTTQFEATVLTCFQTWELVSRLPAAAKELGYVTSDDSAPDNAEEGLAYAMRVCKHDDGAEYKQRVCALVDKAAGSSWGREKMNLKEQAQRRKATEIARQIREEQATLDLPVGSKIQVIVKAADIIVTPENPVYPGGVWHLEGTASENIIATGIYYYAQDNVTPSHLEFRDLVDECDYEYPQCEHDHIYLRYRVENGDQRSRCLGEVSTPTGRCIAFPNDLQHRAAPFQLVDPARIGYRKMLVFFVVDPAKPVTSTATVPRQQGVMPHEQALKNRESLMEARRNFVVVSNEEYEETISLCEH